MDPVQGRKEGIPVIGSSITDSHAVQLKKILLKINLQTSVTHNVAILIKQPCHWPLVARPFITFQMLIGDSIEIPRKYELSVTRYN